jgi:hypothetical protein
MEKKAMVPMLAEATARGPHCRNHTLIVLGRGPAPCP